LRRLKDFPSDGDATPNKAALDTPLKTGWLDDEADTDESIDQDANSREEGTPNERKNYAKLSFAQEQQRTERENYDMQSFVHEQQGLGNIPTPANIAFLLRRTVRDTIFGSVKFANDDKFFHYLAVEDENDWTRGLFFRLVKQGCSMIPRNEETWWYEQRKPVRAALKGKRSTVQQGLKRVMLDGKKYYTTLSL
jgi:hypothetical protein